MKKIKQAFLQIIVLLSICTIMSCDSSSLKNDNDSLLMLAVASSDFTQIEFTILPDTMSWLDCTYTGIVVVGLGSFYTVTGTEGSETLVLNCGNGSVGYHNGSSTASSEYIKYTLDGNDYYGRTADGGNSSICLTKNEGSIMEGTFSGSVCNAVEGCLSISKGSFHAKAKSPK